MSSPSVNSKWSEYESTSFSSTVVPAGGVSMTTNRSSTSVASCAHHDDHSATASNSTLSFLQRTTSSPTNDGRRINVSSNNWDDMCTTSSPSCGATTARAAAVAPIDSPQQSVEVRERPHALLKVVIHDCPNQAPAALDASLAEVFSKHNPLKIHDATADSANTFQRYIEFQDHDTASQAMNDLQHHYIQHGFKLELALFPPLPTGLTFERCLQDGKHCMSIVIEALNATNNARVVLKRAASYKHQKYIEQELAILNQCDGHPHIVQLMEKELVDGWLLMEYMGGGSFDVQCEVPQNLTHREVLQIGAATSNALAFLHSKNIIHRDVKPHNIFFERDDYNEIVTVKLADMGVATSSRDAKYAGTKKYAAPEMVQDRAAPVSDMWSWASTIAHLATGVKPYEGDNKYIPYSEELHDVELPGDLHELLKQFWVHDPSKRPSAEEAHRCCCECLAVIPHDDDEEALSVNPKSHESQQSDESMSAAQQQQPSQTQQQQSLANSGNTAPPPHASSGFYFPSGSGAALHHHQSTNGVAGRTPSNCADFSPANFVDRAAAIANSQQQRPQRAQHKQTTGSSLNDACINGRKDEVTKLLEDGANHNAADAQGRTALMHASSSGHTEVVSILLHMVLTLIRATVAGGQRSCMSVTVVTPKLSTSYCNTALLLM